MSLDVCLKDASKSSPERWTIFIREDGRKKEITLEEWNQRNPGIQPTLCHVGGDCIVYSANITHNLNTMAEAAGIYKPLWRPEEIGIEKAHQLIEPLTNGLSELKADPDKYKIHNPENGWGNYDLLVRFATEYLTACKQNPDTDVSVWR